MKRRYRRYFIILEEEDTGFQLDKHQAIKGYAKIEVSQSKGMMALQCQNLKNVEENRIRYRWYLASTENPALPMVEIGPMGVDESGRGAFIWEFDGENVKGTKESIEAFNLLLMLAEPYEGRGSTSVPLAGYIDKEKPEWRQLVSQKLNKNLVLQGPVAQVAPPLTSPVVEEPLPLVEEPLPLVESADYVPVAGFEEAVDTVQGENLSEAVEAEIISREIDQAEIPTEGEDILQEPAIEAQAILDGPPAYQFEPAEKTIQTYIEATLGMFPPVEPFDEPMENTTWWYVPYNHQTIYRYHMPFMAYLDVINASRGRYPFQHVSALHQQIYYYQHHLFGITYGPDGTAQSYYYAIPTLAQTQEALAAEESMTGYWIPGKKDNMIQEGLGYWIVTIPTGLGY